MDHRTVVREELCALIDRQPDLAVVAQAASVAGARKADVRPHVIVTEIELPDASHDQVIIDLRGDFSQSSILVITLVGQPSKVEAVLAAGADGYLLKAATTADLLTGIRTLAKGERYLQPSLGVELARQHLPRDSTSALSSLEERILRLIAQGHTNAEIARLCHVSLRTVESRRSRIKQKLGRRTRAELVQYACDVGLLANTRR